MSEGLYGPFTLTLLFIGASVFDDFRTRKVHNSLVISTFVLSFLAAIYFYSAASILQILTAIIGTFLFCLPLYLFKALGGGDIKFLVAISPLWTWSDMFGVLFYSLTWGAILGVVHVIIQGKFLSFVENFKSMALRQPVQETSLHKIPYTIAIFFGFLTQWSLIQKGISLI